MPTTNKPLRADAARNRALILAAAGDLFAERGLDVGLEDVAARAGVGVGTLYRRFADRDALIDALFEHRIDDLVERLRLTLEGEDAWAGLVGFLRTTAGELAHDRGMRELFLGANRGQAGLQDGRARLHPLSAELVERARRQGRLRRDFDATDIPVLFVMISGVADFAGTTQPELWSRYLDLFVAGMRPDDPSQLQPSALGLDDLQSAMLAWRSSRA